MVPWGGCVAFLSGHCFFPASCANMAELDWKHRQKETKGVLTLARNDDTMVHRVSIVPDVLLCSSA